jgi:hypothetical protein
MAVWARQDTRLDELVHHSDRGSQYLECARHPAPGRRGAVASVGAKGDSYDNALAEAVNGLYKAELIGPAGRGEEPARWSWPPLSGSGGGTSVACTARWTTSHLQNTKPCTTVSSNSPRRSGKPNGSGLHQTQGSSLPSTLFCSGDL